MPNNTYTGHGANTGGLQQHSCGDMMPLTTLATQTEDGLRWSVIDLRTGKTYGRYVTYKVCETRAYAMLEHIKAGGTLPIIDVAPRMAEQTCDAQSCDYGMADHVARRTEQDLLAIAAQQRRVRARQHAERVQAVRGAITRILTNGGYHA
jgi:alkylhydroperoxidase family enzyme